MFASVDELVELEEGCKIQTEADKFGGGDVEIITHVKNLIVVMNGEIIDVDDSEEEGDGNSICRADSVQCDPGVQET